MAGNSSAGGLLCLAFLPWESVGAASRGGGRGTVLPASSCGGSVEGFL